MASKIFRAKNLTLVATVWAPDWQAECSDEVEFPGLLSAVRAFVLLGPAVGCTADAYNLLALSAIDRAIGEIIAYNAEVVFHVLFEEHIVLCFW